MSNENQEVVVNEDITFNVKNLVSMSFLIGLMVLGSVSPVAAQVDLGQLDPRQKAKELEIEAWGEAGRVALPAAEATMAARHANKPETTLGRHEKAALRIHFGDLVDSVKVVWNAKPLDYWGKQPYAIKLSRTSGQTFDNKIYIRHGRDQLDEWQRLKLLFHEIVHVKQYKKYKSVKNFGYHYMKEYAKADYSYSKNKLEKEAYSAQDGPDFERVWNEYERRSKNLSAGMEIQSFNQWNNVEYVSIKGPANMKYLRARLNNTLTADADVEGTEEIFRVTREGSTVVFQAFNGFYVSAEPDDIGKQERRVVVDRLKVGDAERWIANYLPADNRWTFKAHNGSQLYLRNEGEVVSADGVEQLRLEKFVVMKAPASRWEAAPLRGIYSIKGIVDGKYLNANDDLTVDAGVSSVRRDEKWLIVPAGPNRVAFRSSFEHMLCAEPDDPKKDKVIADRTGIGYAEIWEVISHNDGTYSFKSHHGRYLKSQDEHITTEATAIGRYEKFKLDRQNW